MTRTPLAAAAALVALAAGSYPAAQDAQPPARFKSRVDLITVDIVAVDKQGRPIDDLHANDFAVKVDGTLRPVVSAEFIKADRSQRGAPVPDLDTLVTTNVGAERSRRVVVAVDQTLITPGSIMTVLRSASKFVDALAPADYAAVLAFPEPGPRVDFTTDKARVLDAMQRIVGQPAKNHATTFELSVQEALTIDASERTRADPNAGTAAQILRTLGPAMTRVLERGCRGVALDQLTIEELQQCVRDLGNQAMVDAQEILIDAKLSLRRLQSFLNELAALDGPKSLVLVSAGLVAEDPFLLEEIGKAAADARTTIHVIAVDRERERDHTDLANGQSGMKLQDRGLELQGLETIADRTGGALYRAIGPAVGVFDRLALELSASYLVAVERRENDPDRQKVEVEVKRRGVTVRSPRAVTAVSAVNARRPMPDLLREALGSPLPLPGVPIRLSTFVQRDTSAAATYRVHLAGQIGQPGAPGGAFEVGYVVMDKQDKVVTSWGNHVQLTASGRASEPLPYDTTLSLQPGVYTMRVAVVDSDGRRGTVVRRLELPAVMADAVTTSDLIVGALSADGGAMHPSVEPHVNGRIAAYLEVYQPNGDQGRLTVNLEIAEGEGSPPLTTAALNVGAGAQSNWQVASGAVDVTLLPGRYVARAAVRRDGVPLRVVSRPFVLERGVAPPVASAPAATLAARLSPEVTAKTAGYVSAFVHGLSNVVGREDLMLSSPVRHVTSDFLLVRHPASPNDLLTYRDVTHVNNVAIADRQERLSDLFLKPIGLVRDRVRQITQASEQHVPSILNPIFVLAFLQADFQSRFELTVNDAGAEWPAAVKAVTFVEMARPTILRGGLQGELDVPARGTAWLEPGTGRVLQTELLVPNGRSTTMVVTKFVLDRRLQIMVPEEMRTKNPTGVATYSNFRRFTVQTDTAIR